MPRTINWNDQERKVMEMLNFHRSPMSGAGELFEEDGYTDTLLIQLKSTQGKACTIKLQDWNDLEKHALYALKRTPVFILYFLQGPILICHRPEDSEIVAQHFRGEQQELHVGKAKYDKQEDDYSILL